MERDYKYIALYIAILLSSFCCVHSDGVTPINPPMVVDIYNYFRKEHVDSSLGVISFANKDTSLQHVAQQVERGSVVAANNNIEVINSQTAKVGSLVTLTNDTKVVKQSPQDAYIFIYNGERVNSMDPNTIPILTLKDQSKKYENQQHEND